MAYEDNAFENKFGRFILIGTIHGAFTDCSNDLPGIYIEVDDLSVLEFLHKEAYGSSKSENDHVTLHGCRLSNYHRKRYNISILLPNKYFMNSCYTLVVFVSLQFEITKVKNCSNDKRLSQRLETNLYPFCSLYSRKMCKVKNR